MAERVRTVVYNSSVLDPGDAALRDLLTFAQEQPNVAVDDVAYLRLAPWQDSIALFFDGKETMQELFDLRRVEIACGSDPEAYYLLGWLASRLEWTPCAERQFCNRFGTQIDFTIARDGPPRRIRRVSLASSTTTFVAETDGPDAQAISLTVTGAIAHSPRFHPLTNIDLASLVERAILTGHDDRVFRASLAAAGTILAQKGST
jgi:glucose-6-phosphate dehydrogenase assembly protein OpcA